MRFVATDRLGAGRRGLRILMVLGLLCAVVAAAQPCLCKADCGALGGANDSIGGASVPGEVHGCCAQDAGPQTGEAPASPEGSDGCCSCCFSAPQDLPAVSPTLLVDVSPSTWAQMPASDARMSAVHDDAIASRETRPPIPGRPVYLRLGVLRI